MENSKGKQILSQYSKLVDERQPLEEDWYECFKYTYPIRGQGFTNKEGDGFSKVANARKDAAVLFDSTATDSIRLLASSVLSSITPPHQQWFGLSLSDMSDEDISRNDKIWLEEAAENLFKRIHSSNYDAQALEFFTDEMIGGMAGLYVEKKNGNFIFETWPLASLYCQDTMGDGYIDTIYRLVKYSAAEANIKFAGNLPEEVAKEFKDNPYSNKLFEFVHTIRPRIKKSGKQSDGKLNKSLPFESIYVHRKSGMVCMESGYHEMPVIVPRWMRIPETDYAVGPMRDALPDTKTLNKIVEFMLSNAEMAISGMYVAKDDGVFNPNTARVAPRRIWAVSDTNNIKQLAAGGDIRFATQEIGRLQNQVRRTLLADQLSPSEKMNMSATEINTRTALIRQILGPIFGRFQAEYLVPLIHRCFGLCVRDGDFGEVPESLSAKILNVQYRSPLALAQKQQQLNALDQFETRLFAKLEVNPDLADLYDQDAGLRYAAELLGVELELVRDENEVKKLRKARSDQQAQAQVQAAAQQIGPEAVQAGLGMMSGGM